MSPIRDEFHGLTRGLRRHGFLVIVYNSVLKELLEKVFRFLWRVGSNVVDG